MLSAYRKILGVGPTAGPAEIKSAYRRLAMQSHPDRNNSPAAEQQFKQVSAAYAALMDTADKEIEIPTHRTRTRTSRPQMSITLEECYAGARFRVRGDDVRLPPGIHHGQLVEILGTTVQIMVEPNTRFKRAGNDLLTIVEISGIQAILGCQLYIEHIDRSMLQYTVPAGIQYGQVVRVCGKGMPDPSNGAYGDLLIQVHVITPTGLTLEQLQALSTLFNTTKELHLYEQKS